MKCYSQGEETKKTKVAEEGARPAALGIGQFGEWWGRGRGCYLMVAAYSEDHVVEVGEG
jgi:hypothetical protein